eukprot:CAMPEP_0117664086 /NCGR_PEP_ID=MMETSP0804-20121206/9002_1 /TAXON_ID=1074897 /ORGANISM="Tetraselmis astigmatica, Strain CCMP880" /LENGTH=62 /DNA_ID=CAMNT_0005471235 /DNA_START=1032 /DNA_END=1220 /DNA_ORIENTATION=+
MGALLVDTVQPAADTDSPPIVPWCRSYARSKAWRPATLLGIREGWQDAMPLRLQCVRQAPSN